MRPITAFPLQFEAYNQCKNALKEGEALIHVDYTESYKKQQDEIQSAYFDQSSFSLLQWLFTILTVIKTG